MWIIRLRPSNSTHQPNWWHHQHRRHRPWQTLQQQNRPYRLLRQWQTPQSRQRHQPYHPILHWPTSYTDRQGNSQPINHRLYDHKDKMTKNDYFQEMLNEVITWEIKPSHITVDSWYSSKENLKHIKKAELGFMFAVKANRTVSIKQDEWLQVQKKSFSFTVSVKSVIMYSHHWWRLCI